MLLQPETTSFGLYAYYYFDERVIDKLYAFKIYRYIYFFLILKFLVTYEKSYRGYISLQNLVKFSYTNLKLRVLECAGCYLQLKVFESTLLLSHCTRSIIKKEKIRW